MTNKLVKVTNKVLNHTLDYIHEEEDHVNLRLNLVLGIFLVVFIAITAAVSLLLAEFIFGHVALRFQWVVLFEYPILYMLILFILAFALYYLFDKMVGAWVIVDDEDDEEDEEIDE